MKNINKLLLLCLLAVVFITPNITAAMPADFQIDVDPQGSSSCVNLQNNLRYRMTDAQTNGEVTVLQDFLQSSGYLNTNPVGFFGLLTTAAVKKFQSTHSIAPTGYVGPLTRAQIKVVSCSGSTIDTPPTIPPIISINGCAPGALFSTTTGAPCTTIPTTTDGCATGAKFSSTTGLPCAPSSTIVAPTIQILSPNNTETWVAGKSYDVKWTTSGVPKDTMFNIRLREFYNKQEYNLPPYPASSYNDGIENVTVPSTVPGGTYILEMKGVVNGETKIFSNGYFMISPANDAGCSAGQVYSSTTGFRCPNSTSIAITSPTGQVSWKQNTLATWTWTSPSNVSSVDIFLVNPNGGSDISFAKSYPNNGTFQWAVGYSPNGGILPNGSYKVAVCPAGKEYGPLCGQFSFSIYGDIPSIRITSPLGGETFKVREVIPVTFTNPKAGEKYEINLLKPAIVSPTKYNLGTIIGIAGDQSKNSFAIPPEVPGGVYTVEVLQLTNGGPCVNTCARAESNQFNITSTTASTPITITSPNGGEVFTSGGNNLIAWSGGVYPVQVGVVKSTFPYDNSVVGWIQARGNANDRVYWDGDRIGPLDYLTSGQWLHIAPGTYKILVVAPSTNGNQCFSGTGCNYDVSDQSFTIPSVATPPAITITDPSGNQGVTVNVGGTFTIQGMPSNLQGLTYGTGAGQYTRAFFFNSQLATCTNNEASNNGLWTLTCTATSAGTNTIRVEIYKNGQTYASNNVVVISNQEATKPSVTVTSPSAGAQWQVGSTQNITWRPSGFSSGATVAIGLVNVTDGWNLFFANAPVSQGSYSWTIPTVLGGQGGYALIQGKQYKIYIAETTPGVPKGSLGEGYSNVFGITSATSQPSITVTSPRSGDTFAEGKPVNITWNTTGLSVNQGLDIALNIGSGSTGQGLVYNTPNTGSYTWIAKSIPSYGQQYNISVLCPVGKVNCTFSPNSGQSGVFTITPPATTAAPVVNLSASPTTILSDGKLGATTLTWTSTNATYCMVERQQMSTSGSLSVPVSQTGIYTISCTGPGGTAYSNPVTVNFQINAPAPTISSIGPTTGTIGTVVTIVGTGFTATGNTVIFGGHLIKNISSVNGTSIGFQVPSAYTYAACMDYNPPCSIQPAPVVPGPVDISVKNANGTSAVRTFTVTASSDPRPTTQAAPNGASNAASANVVQQFFNWLFSK